MSARKTSARRNLGSSGTAFKRSAPPDWRSQLRCSTALVPLERILVPAVLAGGLLGSVSALANPLDGQVVGGTATISQPSTTQTVINQSSQSTVINWQSFNIPQGSQVDFNQPNSSSVALNRDLGNNASQIAGQLNANGQVWIVNPNGVAFTPTAQVNVGGLVATTSNISNSNFLAGIYKFDQAGKPTASVINQGNITVRQAGLADLVAPSVSNSGMIQAKLGKVNLASGSAYTIDMYGDGMIKFAVSDQTAAAIAAARVSNTGTINAAGGTVTLSVSQAESIVDNSINAGGTITAHSSGGHAGQITVDGNGGTTVVSGTLDASGTGAGQSGGTVKVLGGQVRLTSTAKIDVSGDAGGGNVDVGGDFHGAGPDADATNTVVQQGATINADAITNGNGGQVAIWSNDTTSFGGTISARGGAQGGNGGYVETSGKQTLNLLANALVDTSAPKGLTGTWLLDPNDFTVNGGNNTTIDTDLNTTDVLISASGNIDVDADIVPVNTSLGNHTLGLSAGEDINLGANINFATNSSSGNLYMNAGGSILRTAGTLTMDGGALSMSAIGDIGSSGSSVVTAGVEHLAATAGGSAPGGVFITNSGSTVLALGVPAYTINTTTGTILQATGDTAITTFTFGAVTGLTETAGGDITLDNSGNDFGSNEPITISGGDGAITLTGNDITLAGVNTGGAGGTLTLNTAAGTGTLTLIGATYSVGADGTAYSYTAAGGIDLSGSDTLDNATTFGSNVTLTAPTTLTGGSASDAITFSGKLDGAFAFETNIAGLTTFGGAVGGITPLANLTVTGPTEINTATVTTAGEQQYDSGVTLGVATTTLTTTDSLVSLGNVSGGTDTLAISSGSSGATLNGVTAGALTVTTTGVETLNAGTYTIGTGSQSFGAVTTNGTLTLGLPTTFTGAVTLGSATTFDSSAVNGAETFDTTIAGAANALTVNAGSGNIAFDSTVGASGAGIGAFGVTTTGTTTLGGDVYAASLNISGATALGSTVGVFTDTADTGTGADGPITFGGNIAGGTNDLALKSGAGAITLNGITAGPLTVATTGLETIDAGTYDINGGTGTVTFASAGGVNLDGAITLDNATNFGSGTSAVSLTGATTLHGNATADTIDFAGTLDGAFALNVTGSQTTILDPAIGGITPLASIDIAGPTDLQASATTTGTQTYSGAVTLTGDVTLKTTNSLIDFGNTVDDSTADTHSLAIQSGTGGVTFGSAVGGIHPLASLDTTGTTGTNRLDGNVTTGGLQTYGGAVTVGGNITLATTNSLVDFVSTVDDATNDTHSLAIQSGTGGVTFGAAVGGIHPLASLDTSGTGGTNTLDGNVSTGGAQTYGGPVTLNAASVTLTTTNALVTLPPVSVATATDTLTVNSGAGGVILNGVTAHALTLTTTGVETVNAGTYDIDGGTGTVTFGSTGGVNLDGTITLDNATTFGSGTSAVTLTGATTLHGGVTADTIDFAGTLDGAFALNVTGSETTVFDLLVGNPTPLASIDIAGPTDLQASATTTGTQTYSGAVTLTGDVTLKTTNSLIDFGNTVDDSTADTHSLAIQSGTGGVTFGSAVGGIHPLASLDTTGTTGTNRLDGNVTTGGAQTYGGAVMLGATPIVLTTGAGAVTFDGTVAGAGDALTLHSTGGGAITFDSMVGSSGSPLGAVALTTSGPTLLGGAVFAASLDASGATGSITLDGGVTTSGVQTYGGAVTLGAANNLTGTTVTFDSTIGGAYALRVTGNGVFDGTVNIASLDVTGTAGLDGATVTTSGTQAYRGAVTLGTDNDLTGTAVTFDSTVDGAHNLTVTGNGVFDGAVGGTAKLASLTVTGTSDLNGGAVSTTGAQGYDQAVTLSGDDDLTATIVTFGSTVDGAHNLTVTGNGVFDGAVGGTAKLASLTVTGTSDLNGGAVSTTGAQGYDQAVTLSGDDDLTGTTVTFGSTVDGAHNLTVTGNGVFDGAVGSTAKLASLTVTGTSDLNGGAVSTTGAQGYDQAVTLSGDDDLTATIVTFGSTVDGAHNLTVTGNGVFDGAVGGTTKLASLTVTGTSDLNGGAVSTTGAQGYDQAMTLSGDDDLTATIVTFGSTVDGAHNLTVTGNGVFDGAVGGTTKLASLTVTGTSDLNGGAVSTTGAQGYDQAVTLSGDDDLTGTTVTFGSTVDGAHNLTVTGNGVFDGAVGGTTKLASLTVTGTSDLNGGAVSTTGAQGYDQAVTLSGDDDLTGTTVTFGTTVDGAHNLTVTGNGVFDGAVGGTAKLASLTVTGTSDLNGGAVSTTGAQGYDQAVTLSGDDDLTGTTVTFGSTVDGAHNLTVTGNGVFDGAVGGTTKLASLTVTGTSDLNGGAVSTTGAQGYDQAVTLSGDDDLTGTTVTFGSTVDGAHNLTVTGNGVFDGAVGSTAKLASLTVTGTSDLNGGAVSTTGAQGYDQAVTLSGDDDLTATIVTFGSTVDGAHNLTVTGNGVFDGAVGGTTKLASLTVTGTSDLNGGAVSTTGAQGYDQAVTLSGDDDLTATIVTFGSTVDGAHNLTVTGNGVFDGAVGGTTKLASLTVTGTSDLNGGAVSTTGAQGYDQAVTLSGDDDLTATIVTFGSTVDGAHNLTVTGNGVFDGAVGGTTKLASLTVTGTSDLNGGAVSTTGAQGYDQAVTLSGDDDLTATIVTFGSTVDGAHNLTVTGNGVFDGAVGGTAKLASLTVTGTSDLNGGAVSTTGAQGYDQAVTLSGDDDLTGTTVTFGSTVDGAHNLTVTGNGVFDGAVGSTAKLASLTVTGTSDLNGGAVSTTGAQGYDQAVTLSGDDDLTATIVTFGSTVDGAHNLTVTGNGVFDGAVGGTTKLASLTVTGTSDLNGGAVSTTGAQGYDQAMTLSGDDDLTATIVTFGSTVDGAHNLTVTGNGVFDGAVGGTTKLASLTVTGTSDLNGGAVSTTGAQGYDQAVTLSGDDDLTGTTVTFGSTVDGAHNLTVTGNGVFDGAVGGTTKLASLTVTGTSDLNGGAVSTTGAQGYDQAVTLSGDDDLTGTTVTFGTTVDGAHNLTVTGNGVFDGAVGGTAKLASLTVTGTSDLNGGAVSTTGAQGYDQAVTLSGDDDLTGTTVTFGSTVDGAHNLTVTGNGVFDGAVGGTAKLASLTVTGTSDLNGGAVSTTAMQGYDGAVTLSANNTLNVSTATFDSTIGGPYALVINGNALFHRGSGAASTTVSGTINNVSSNVIGVIGIATVLGLINDLEDQINRGGTGETAAQAAFEQRVYKADYAVDPFALKYNILGLGGSDVPGFNDISYVLDGFWENLIKKQP